MKKYQKYSADYDAEKARVVAIYGLDITSALVNEYRSSSHSMKVKEQGLKTNYLDKTYSNEAKQIDLDFAPAESVDLQNYEKEL